MAISPNHALCKKTDLSIKDLDPYEFIVYGQSSETFHVVEKAFAEATLRFDSSIQVGSMAAIKEMAKVGMGVGLMAPWIALEELTNGDLSFRPIPEIRIERQWGIFCDERHEITKVERAFINLAKSIVESKLFRTQEYLDSL